MQLQRLSKQAGHSKYPLSFPSLLRSLSARCCNDGCHGCIGHVTEVDSDLPCQGHCRRKRSGALQGYKLSFVPIHKAKFDRAHDQSNGGHHERAPADAHPDAGSRLPSQPAARGPRRGTAEPRTSPEGREAVRWVAADHARLRLIRPDDQAAKALSMLSWRSLHRPRGAPGTPRRDRHLTLGECDACRAAEGPAWARPAALTAVANALAALPAHAEVGPLSSIPGIQCRCTLLLLSCFHPLMQDAQLS